MTRTAPICLVCKHYNRDENATKPTCKAFPDRIPAAIRESRLDHRLPIAGDHGITFEPTSPRGAEYAVEIFGPLQVAEPIAA
jgi:hypothetical protein